jgi:hypothetical protein
VEENCKPHSCDGIDGSTPCWNMERCVRYKVGGCIEVDVEEDALPSMATVQE